MNSLPQSLPTADQNGPIICRFDFGAPTSQDFRMNISDLSAAQLSQAANIKAQIEKL